LVLVVFGLLLVGSSDRLAEAIGLDPIGALTTILPTWYLVPFAVVAVLGLVGGAVLDIYSSGLALLTLGVRIPRYLAAAVDGVIMAIGSFYVVFVADSFIGPFTGFLITVGVPIAAWCGVFIADLVLRRGPYSDAELYDVRGRYGAVQPVGVGLVVLGTGRQGRPLGLRQPRGLRRPADRLPRLAAARQVYRRPPGVPRGDLNAPSLSRLPAGRVGPCASRRGTSTPLSPVCRGCSSG
jgi:hypothetical protein